MTEPTPRSLPGIPIERESPTFTRGLDELRAALLLQREADAMVAEAVETRRSAVERAESLVREAEQAAARAEEEAAIAAAQRIAAARDEADRLLAAAAVQADEITSDAHAEVADLRHDAAELRDSAQQTVHAAELELERMRDAEAERERQLRAIRAEAIAVLDHLERVAASLEDEAERARAEVASARSNLARLPGHVATSQADVASPSVVLQWPHLHPEPQAADAPSADTEEELPTSRHRRADNASRRGRLRRTRT